MNNSPEILWLSAFGRFPPSWLHLLEALLALQQVEPSQLLHYLIGPEAAVHSWFSRDRGVGGTPRGSSTPRWCNTKHMSRARGH